MSLTQSVTDFGLECPEGTVPGWLDETGAATSCVSNDPTPGEVFSPEPAISSPAFPDALPLEPLLTLPETGVSDPMIWVLMFICLGMVTVGYALIYRSVK